MLAASITVFDPQRIWSFLAGEIPFILFMAFLVYIFWIRQKRKERREKADPNRKTEIGDELLFRDGMVGILAKYKNGVVTVESGSSHDKYQISDEFFVENLSAAERNKKHTSSSHFGKSCFQKYKTEDLI